MDEFNGECTTCFYSHACNCYLRPDRRSQKGRCIFDVNTSPKESLESLVLPKIDVLCLTRLFFKGSGFRWIQLHTSYILLTKVSRNMFRYLNKVVDSI